MTVEQVMEERFRHPLGRVREDGLKAAE